MVDSILTFGPPNVKNVTLVFKAHFQPCFEMSSHFSFNVTEAVTKLRLGLLLEK